MKVEKENKGRMEKVVVELESEEETGMEWGVVCSVPETELGRAEVEEFFAGLVKGLGRVELRSKPLSLTYASGLDKGGFCGHYRQLCAAKPQLLVLFAVLPKHNCAEFDWLKNLAHELNIAAQAILKDNVHTNFQYAISQARHPLSLPEIVANIGDGFANKLRHITGSLGNKRHLRGPRQNLRIISAGSLRPEIALVMAAAEAEAEKGEGDGKTKLPPRTQALLLLSDEDLETMVLGLHAQTGKGDEEMMGDERPLRRLLGPTLGQAPPSPGLVPMPGGLGWTTEASAKEFQRDTDLVVTGFPRSFTQFQIGAIFHAYPVKEVRLSLDLHAAFVRLSTKEEVQKAVEALDGQRPAAKVGPLYLRPVDEELLRRMEAENGHAHTRPASAAALNHPPLPYPTKGAFPAPAYANPRRPRTRSEIDNPHPSYAKAAKPRIAKAKRSKSSEPQSPNANAANAPKTVAQAPNDPASPTKPQPPLLAYGMIQQSDEA